jgi:multiple sugar transport system substrate-binding protein
VDLGIHRRTIAPGALGLSVAAGLAAAAARTVPEHRHRRQRRQDAPKKASGNVTFGSNSSDEVPKKAIAEVIANFQKANPGVTAKINTVDHNTFQEQINSYLQGSPDDVFSWFAGFRMRFFAAKGLAGDISDVWANMEGMSDALKGASTGDDGKQYFVPFTNYPWAVFYRKSVFEKNGYEIPKTLDDLTALGAAMKKDGLTPIAFGDKDGWPAMGTFDQLNMRVNGYDFHVELMAGKKAWNSAEVKKVFETWRELLPLHQEASLGRTWQEAAQSLLQKKSGMYVLGMFVGEQFPEADREDLDFFNFPEIDSGHRRRRHRGPDRRLHDVEATAQRGRRQGAPGLPRHRLRPRRCRSRPTRPSSPSTARPTRRATPACRRRPSSSSRAPSPSRSSWTATPALTSPSNVMIPAIQTFIKNPATWTDW